MRGPYVQTAGRRCARSRVFDEPIPGTVEWRAKRSLRDCELFIAIGTSGTVSPAANFVRSAEYAGAHTVLINLELMEPRHPAFQREILGRAEEIVPRLFGWSPGPRLVLNKAARAPRA
jgi:NAD-dependent deacetylase